MNGALDDDEKIRLCAMCVLVHKARNEKSYYYIIAFKAYTQYINNINVLPFP